MESEFALKRMICQTDEQIAEARKEMQLMTLLKGKPNVIQLIASEIRTGKTKGHHLEALFLMPLYEESLQARIDDGPGYPDSAFKANETIYIIQSFVQGLLAIHSLGYRHCDFKPANVLLRRQRRRPAREREERGEGERDITDAQVEVVVTDLGSASPLTVTVTNRAEALVSHMSMPLVHICIYVYTCEYLHICIYETMRVSPQLTKNLLSLFSSLLYSLLSSSLLLSSPLFFSLLLSSLSSGRSRAGSRYEHGQLPQSRATRHPFCVCDRQQGRRVVGGLCHI